MFCLPSEVCSWMVGLKLFQINVVQKLGFPAWVVLCHPAWFDLLKDSFPHLEDVAVVH